jgi:hypothetical protein
MNAPVKFNGKPIPDSEVFGPMSKDSSLDQRLAELLDDMQLSYASEQMRLQSKLERGVIKPEEYTARCSDAYQEAINECVENIKALYNQERKQDD